MAIDKENTLYIRWSKKENDVTYCYPSSPDGRLLHYYMGSPKMTVDTSPDNPYGYTWLPSLLEELEKRGYDLKTLKFSIKKKTVAPTKETSDEVPKEADLR